MIHCETPQAVYNARNIPFWLLSAFKAGFINSAGFLLIGEFVSHVTGFGTRVGIAIGHHGYFMGLELLIIPIAFIGGGIATSAILDRKKFSEEVPAYYKVQGLITLLIAVVIGIGEKGWVSDKIQFGADWSYSLAEFVVLGLLCFICGLKNGLVAWTTHGKIRVTHLTGLSTDIGLNFIHMFKPRSLSPRFKETAKVNVVRMLIMLCFSVGAFTSAIIFPQIGYQGFFIVFFISLIMTIYSIYDSFILRRQDRQQTFR